MNRKLLAVAVAGAFAASGSAFAGKHDNDHGPGATVNGYVMSTFTITDDFGEDQGFNADGNPANDSERKFNTFGKLGFGAMVSDDAYARIDVVLNNPYASDNFEIQQAFGSWRVQEMAKVQIGRFNSPLGIEAHNKSDLTTISHGLIRTDVLNHQITQGDGNNIEGVAVHLMAGPAKVTLGLLNEIGGVDDENSFLLNVSGSPIDGLDLSLGVLTQEDNTPSNDESYENLINFNVAYGMDMGDISWKVWLDYITAGEVLDNGYSLGGYVGLPNNFGVTLRYDMIEYDGGAEDTAITLAGHWQPADNVDLRLEWRNDDIESGGLPAVDGDTITLAAVFKF
jgi:hypothetical protein